MKHLAIICISFIFCLIFALIGYTQIDQEAVVGAWLFDEGSGDIAKDLTSKSGDGKPIKGPGWENGKSGKAISFKRGVRIIFNSPKIMASQISEEIFVPASILGKRKITPTTEIEFINQSMTKFGIPKEKLDKERVSLLWDETGLAEGVFLLRVLADLGVFCLFCTFSLV